MRVEPGSSGPPLVTRASDSPGIHRGVRSTSWMTAKTSSTGRPMTVTIVNSFMISRASLHVVLAEGHVTKRSLPHRYGKSALAAEKDAVVIRRGMARGLSGRASGFCHLVEAYVRRY